MTRWPFVNYNGKQFGAWIVIKYVGIKHHGCRYWLCKCKCGYEAEHTTATLKKLTACHRCSPKGAEQLRVTQEPPSVQGARWIALTKRKFALVDATDFDLLAKFNWSYSCGAAVANVNGKMVLMHRLLLQVTGEVDHINRNRLDNRRGNLREATRSQNAANRDRQSNSGHFKGVRWRPERNRWQARLTVERNEKHLGYFTDEIEAACAYNAAAIKHFGEFARLNRMD